MVLIELDLSEMEINPGHPSSLWLPRGHAVQDCHNFGVGLSISVHIILS